MNWVSGTLGTMKTHGLVMLCIAPRCLDQTVECSFLLKNLFFDAECLLMLLSKLKLKSRRSVTLRPLCSTRLPVTHTLLVHEFESGQNLPTIHLCFCEDFLDGLIRRQGEDGDIHRAWSSRAKDGDRCDDANCSLRADE